MAGKHRFPPFLLPQPGLQALTVAHRNHIENPGAAVGSLNVEKEYRKQFPSQQQEHYWDYYVAAGKPRGFRNRYVEVHPGLSPGNPDVIAGMLKKVNWLKAKIRAGDLPETEEEFIWARAGGNSDLSKREALILAQNGLSLPKRRIAL